MSDINFVTQMKNVANLQITKEKMNKIWLLSSTDLTPIKLFQIWGKK